MGGASLGDWAGPVRRDPGSITASDGGASVCPSVTATGDLLMPIYLKQSTASQEVPLGYFLDSTDGNTEETALTIANTDIKLWKFGATTLANKNSGGATHISNGVYYAVLDAADTDTRGSLIIFVHVAGALSVRVECVVLAANIYDSLIGGGDLLDVELGTVATAANLATVAGYIDTEVAAIKAKTDSLTFTVAGQVDANTQSVNDVTVNGDGAGTPWGP
jgi:hypothetical protein